MCIRDRCDDDIAGDGIKNPVGAVDESGNINIARYQNNHWSWNNNLSHWDNCIFIKNQNQDDSNKNWIWDVCDEDDIQWVSITTVSYTHLDVYKRQGQSLFGVNGTPGNVLINKKTGKYVVVSGAQPLTAFQSAIAQIK